MIGISNAVLDQPNALATLYTVSEAQKKAASEKAVFFKKGDQPICMIMRSEAHFFTMVHPKTGAEINLEYSEIDIEHDFFFSVGSVPWIKGE